LRRKSNNNNNQKAIYTDLESKQLCVEGNQQTTSDDLQKKRFRKQKKLRQQRLGARQCSRKSKSWLCYSGEKRQSWGSTSSEQSVGHEYRHQEEYIVSRENKETCE
jgi:hypothetical protein